MCPAEGVRVPCGCISEPQPARQQCFDQVCIHGGVIPSCVVSEKPTRPTAERVSGVRLFVVFVVQIEIESLDVDQNRVQHGKQSGLSCVFHDGR